MPRLNPDFKFKLDRVDAMLALALTAIVTSYTLGYQLDWSQVDNAANDIAAIEPVNRNPIAAEITPEMKPEPSAQPTIGPSPQEENWDYMTQELARHAARHPGRVAIYLRDLKSDKTWSYHPDDLFPSASLIKVPVMIGVFSRIKEGRLTLGEQLTLRRAHRVGGSGSLKWRPDGTRLTVRELVQRMISESDNTATRMLIDAVGFDYLQQQFPKMGLQYTGIFEEGMSIKGGRVEHENYTTAREMNMLMEKIYRGDALDSHSSNLMLEVLKHRKAVASRLAKGLPRGWEIAHKTGLLRQACHDSAIIFTPQGAYAITVLTGQNSDYKSAKDFISRLARITFRHYGGSPHYYAKASSRRQFALR
jgi:beta-lactamase class A